MKHFRLFDQQVFECFLIGLFLNNVKVKKIWTLKRIKHSICNNFKSRQSVQSTTHYTEFPTTKSLFQMLSKSWLTAWLMVKLNNNPNSRRTFTMNWSNSWEKWRLVFHCKTSKAFQKLQRISSYSLCLSKTYQESTETNIGIDLALSTDHRCSSWTSVGRRRSLDIWSKRFWKSCLVFYVEECFSSRSKCFGNAKIDLHAFHKWQWACGLVERNFWKGKFKLVIYLGINLNQNF